MAIPTQIKGFQFAGVYAGIKENPNKLDLAIIYSEVPCTIAAAFTSNRLKAAPVLLGLKQIKSGKAQAIIINSGNANVATGKAGMKAAEEMVKITATALNLSPSLVYVSSTGKIGVPFPIHKISPGVQKAVATLSSDNLPQAAEAIITTDQFVKIDGLKDRVKGAEYTLVGFAKGAGMIEPAMKGPSTKHATMLGYFMTDLAIEAKTLQSLFNRVVESTFNRISVDGDMSTNDTAMILANGLAGNPPKKLSKKDLESFEKNLTKLAKSLALKIVEDGEGATKVVEILIKNAKNSQEAKTIAYRVARSQLVKTSFFGEDPNWGRLIAAVGYSDATFDPSRVDIYYDKVRVAAAGISTGAETERQAHEVMKNRAFKVTIDLKQGKGEFGVWVSDLTTEYVKLNAEYRT